jgi:hypothetical protein
MNERAEATVEEHRRIIVRSPSKDPTSPRRQRHHLKLAYDPQTAKANQTAEPQPPSRS